MNEPELRFKADDGKEFPKWKRTTLGELGQVSMCRRIFKDQTTDDGEVPFYKIGTFGDKPDAFISRELFEEYKNKYPYPEIGNILISASGSIGRTVEYTGADEYFQDSNIVWLAHNDRVLDGYLKCFYSTVNWNGLEGSTIKRLYNKIILNTSINLPCIEEQQKIADLFSTLDDVIDSVQKEVESWEQMKRGLMQKLFSQEVRFKADDGTEFPEWEKKHIRDISSQLTDIINPKTYPTDTFIEYSMPAYDNGYADKVFGLSMNSARKILSEPCVLINKLNVRKRRIWVVSQPETNAVCSSEFVPVAPKKCILEYLGQYVTTDEFTNYLVDCSSGTSNSQKRVTPNVIMNAVIPYPCIEEQQKIADCLSEFDSVIDKTKQKLEAYKQLKKGLMQRMFV